MTENAPTTGAASPASGPAALAVIPCLNEAAHIEAIARRILEEADRIPLRLVIADGGSTDGSRELARRLAAEDSRVFFLQNDKRIQSAALNLAVRSFGAGCEFLIRVDAHARYPDRYCENLLREQAATGADSVVVSMIAEGETGFQRAAAAAQNSLLGNGGSAHRRSGEGRFVDHGHHALMRIEAFQSVSGYDETFRYNEDAELDMRLRAQNYRIWLSATPPMTYFPRSTAWALLRQYFNYGAGRVQTLFKQHARPKLRQSLPLAVAPALALAALSPLWPVCAVPAAAWASLCVTYGLLIGLRRRDACAALSGFAAMIMHAGWSAGFLSGAASLTLKRMFRAAGPSIRASGAAPKDGMAS
jgi:succinoglycan biosynthesis protein ExoA